SGEISDSRFANLRLASRNSARGTIRRAHRSSSKKRSPLPTERHDPPSSPAAPHDLQLNYVGHAAHCDRIQIDGGLPAKDCTWTSRTGARKLAVRSIGRDCDSLAAEYAEAGLIEKSVAFWGKAGRRSFGRSAMAEAVAQFQKGLDELEPWPDAPELQRQELEL